jgi:hypothetical protein
VNALSVVLRPATTCPATVANADAMLELWRGQDTCDLTQGEAAYFGMFFAFPMLAALAAYATTAVAASAATRTYEH